jgi:hypothetical protein
MPCRKTKGEILDMAVESLGSPGIVVHPEIAGKTRCKCYDVDGKLMCFQSGIIGTLSQSQVEAFCKDKEVLTEGPLVDRVRRFREAAKESLEAIKEIPKGERLEPYLLHMGESLRKRGIEL